MSELFIYFDQAEKLAKEAMLDILYHNLSKVSHMYKSTFKIAFPDFSQISSDIVTRHDLVHRNGKTKKEGQMIVVDELSVDKVISRIENFVALLDRELKSNEESEEIKTFVDPEDF